MSKDNIASRAMVVSLSISTWTGRKLDKGVTRSANNAFGATEGAGRYNKQLLPKEALEPIIKVVSAARTYLYDNTLPWKDNGERVLLSVNYFDHMQKIREFKNDFLDEVDNFATRYNEFREKARFELNHMFKSDDYPSIDEIRSKFSFNHRISPIPVANDFRVEMSQDEVEKVREEIEEATRHYAEQAMQNVWEQLRKTIGHMAERLGDPKAKFHATTITNLEDLVGRIPHLNLTEDPALVEQTKEIKDCLVGYTAEELKKDPQVRQGVAKEADRIMDKMKGMFA